eukprot:UN16252
MREMLAFCFASCFVCPFPTPYQQNSEAALHFHGHLPIIVFQTFFFTPLSSGECFVLCIATWSFSSSLLLCEEKFDQMKQE